MSVAFQDVHNQEIKKYRGEAIEAPKQLRFKDGGGDLMVELETLRQGWKSEDNVNVSGELKLNIFLRRISILTL